MKVTIFYESDEPRNRYGYCKVPLEKRINDFIKDKKVIDIKYQANVSSYANESFHDTDELERALVMYEEKDDEWQKARANIALATIDDYLRGHINKEELKARYEMYSLNPKGQEHD